MMKKVILCERPYQLQLPKTTRWLVVSQNDSTSSLEEILSTWSYVCRSLFAGSLFDDEPADGVGLEVLLLKIRASPADVIVLSKTDWTVLEPEIRKPIVPIHKIVLQAS